MFAIEPYPMQVRWHHYRSPWGVDVYVPIWEKTMRRYSATILIETDDRVLALTAAQAMQSAAATMLGEHGRVVQSDLMDEAEIP